jgi:WD40 repeat protein
MIRYQTQKLWLGLLVCCILVTSCTPVTAVPSAEPTIIFPSPSITPTVSGLTVSNINQAIEQPNWKTAQTSWGKGAIRYGEFSPDTKRCGVVIHSGVYIYDVKTLEQLQFFYSDLPVGAAAFAPDWSLLAMATDSSVTLQKLSDKKIVARLETKQGLVSRLRFSPDGSLLAVFVKSPGDEVYSYTVELWSIAERKLLSNWEISVYDGTAFSADGKTFYAWIIHGSQMEGGRRWQLPSGTPLPAWKDLNLIPVAFSQDGNLWATDSSDDVLIFDVATQKRLHRLSSEDAGWVYPLQFSPDASLLAGVTKDHVIKVWNISNEALLYSLKTASSINLFLAFSPDNKMLAIPTPDGVAFYSLANGQLLNELHGHINTTNQAAISPQGDKVAALVIGDGLIVWDALRGQMAYSLSKTEALYLAWSPDGQWLGLAGWDGNIHILEAETGKTIRKIPTHTEQIHSVAFSPDGLLLASSSMESVKIWRFSDGTLLQSFSVAGGWVDGVKFSQDGKYLAATSADAKVEIWQVSDGQHIAEFLAPEIRSGRDVVAFTPSGDFLAVGETGQIVLWRLTEPKPFQILPTGNAEITTLRISMDGTLLICGMADGAIQFWQIPEGKLLRTSHSEKSAIVSLDFSADGWILLTASREGTIHLLSLKH